MTACVRDLAQPVCPVCWAPAEPTAAANIAGHFDSSGQTCPATGYPFRIVVRRSLPLNAVGGGPAIRTTRRLPPRAARKRTAPR
jgi:hypothetical protein